MTGDRGLAVGVEALPRGETERAKAPLGVLPGTGLLAHANVLGYRRIVGRNVRASSIRIEVPELMSERHQLFERGVRKIGPVVLMGFWGALDPDPRVTGGRSLQRVVKRNLNRPGVSGGSLS
jgi:hypothetical protein